MAAGRGRASRPARAARARAAARQRRPPPFRGTRLRIARAEMPLVDCSTRVFLGAVPVCANAICLQAFVKLAPATCAVEFASEYGAIGKPLVKFATGCS